MGLGFGVAVWFRVWVGMGLVRVPFSSINTGFGRASCLSSLHVKGTDRLPTAESSSATGKQDSQTLNPIGGRRGGGGSQSPKNHAIGIADFPA